MIVVVGLSHRSASIAVRERLALPREEIPDVLAELAAHEAVSEALMVSTCNRVEVVATGADLHAAAEAVRSVLTARAPPVARHLYVHEGADAVRHLFRVASSLDSLVLGEPQILGQVKEAFEVARAAGSVGAVLNGTVPRAIRTAKRVRTQTAIGSGQVSVPSVAVDLATQIFADLKGRRVALVGSGEMAEAVARLLAQAGAKLSVIGRNADRVAEIAGALGGEARGWHELRACVAEVDVVVTSTSAPAHVVDFDMLNAVKRSRRGRSLFLIDLAVPRDVDPRVDSIDGVFLYNVDDFSKVVAESAAGRRREAEQAEQIVAREVLGYDRWAEVTQLKPAIVALRERFQSVVHGEVEKSLKTKLKHLGDSDRVALGKMADAILNKLLHTPTQRLRELASESEDAVQLLVELFEIDPGAEANRSGEHAASPADQASEEDEDSAEGDEDFADSNDEEGERALGTGSR